MQQCLSIKIKPQLSLEEEIVIKHNQEMATLVSADIVDIDWNNCGSFIKILSLILEWHCSQICVRNNFVMKGDSQQPKIGKSMVSLGFPNLKKLYLLRLKIQSIQFLSSINAPNITLVDLSRNSITCSKGLRKWNFPFIYRMFLGNCPLMIVENPLKDLSSLTDLNCRNLNEMHLEYLKHHSCLDQNYRFFFKSNIIQDKLIALCTSSEYSVLKSDRRIKDLKLKEKMSHRFPLITVRDKQYTHFLGGG